MVWKVDLRTHDGRLSERLVTESAFSAEAHFRALLARTDLVGQPVAARIVSPITGRAVYFSRFDRDGFLRILEKHKERRELCRFVALPDVVGSARRTLEAFDHWYGILEGWPRALVAQDGIENLPIPWSAIDAIFIGGSTKFKLSKDAADVIRTAKILGKWIHAGRVNTPGRLEYFDDLGADSIDGTGLARYSWMREKIYRAANEPDLFSQEKAS